MTRAVRRRGHRYKLPPALRTCFTKTGKAKRRFPTKEDADVIATPNHKQSYECALCKCWHIGTTR